MKVAALLFAVLAVSLSIPTSAARTRKITLDIHATPEGAQVLSGDVPRVMGVTPLALVYEIPGDCGQTQAVKVHWASGAEASVAAIALCSKTGKHQTFTFTRPADSANLELDLQVAYQQAMLAQLQALARAANDPPPPTLNPYTAPPKTSAICVTRQVANGVTYVSCQ